MKPFGVAVRSIGETVEKKTDEVPDPPRAAIREDSEALEASC
jgi:hypothetical protein